MTSEYQTHLVKVNSDGFFGELAHLVAKTLTCCCEECYEDCKVTKIHRRVASRALEHVLRMQSQGYVNIPGKQHLSDERCTRWDEDNVGYHISGHQ